MWLSVSDSLLNNNAQNITEQINTATNSKIGGVDALATQGSYYQSLRLTAAVVAGGVVGSFLLLAFTLKEDKSTININASNRIVFNVNNTQLTKINKTGLSIYHPAFETFP